MEDKARHLDIYLKQFTYPSLHTLNAVTVQKIKTRSFLIPLELSKQVFKQV